VHGLPSPLRWAARSCQARTSEVATLSRGELRQTRKIPHFPPEVAARTGTVIRGNPGRAATGLLPSGQPARHLRPITSAVSSRQDRGKRG
jgi:hypothetical protein